MFQPSPAQPSPAQPSPAQPSPTQPTHSLCASACIHISHTNHTCSSKQHTNCKAGTAQHPIIGSAHAAAMQGVRSAEKLPGLLACIHSNNVMLRWLLLHMAGHPQSKLSAAVAKQSIDKDAVIRLLLDSAYLESWVSWVPICWRTHSFMSSAGVQMIQVLTSSLYVVLLQQPATQDALNK
jgi:hypothetical protein